MFFSAHRKSSGTRDLVAADKSEQRVWSVKNSGIASSISRSGDQPLMPLPGIVIDIARRNRDAENSSLSSGFYGGFTESRRGKKAAWQKKGKRGKEVVEESKGRKMREETKMVRRG